MADFSGCHTNSSLIQVRDIYDAENQLYTPSGHLIVSGGDNVYLMIPSSSSSGSVPSSYTAAAILPDNTYSLGLSVLGGHLYMATQKALFVVPDIDDAVEWFICCNRPLSSKVLPVLDLSKLSQPNGMATDGVSKLYLADTGYKNLFKGGAIYLIQFATSPVDDPTAVQSFLPITTSKLVTYPNGLRWWNQSLWTTDLGEFKQLQLSIDGTTITSHRLLWKGFTVLDDLAIVSTGGVNLHSTLSNAPMAIVCDILSGSLLFIDLPSGNLLYQTPHKLYHGPSSVSVTWNSGGLDLTVTDKGVVRQRDYQYGDYVSHSPLLPTAACALHQLS
jgi:hypothetical protein